MSDIHTAVEGHHREEDKARLTEIINTILSMGHIVMKKGVLALDWDIRGLKPIPVVLRIGVRIICNDGWLPEDEFRAKLDNYIKAKSFTGFDLVEGTIIREGLLLVCNCEQDEIILKKLASLAGQEFRESFDDSVLKISKTEDMGQGLWNRMDIKVAQEVFRESSGTIISMLETLRNLDSQQRLKIEELFCNGWRLDNLADFFQVVIDNELGDHYAGAAIARIERELALNSLGGHNWNLYLQDALDILMLWERHGCDFLDRVHAHTELILCAKEKDTKVFESKNIQEFNYLVPYEAIQIYRWDKIEFSAARELFGKHDESINLLFEVSERLEQEEFRTIERYLCDGRRLDIMLRFLETVVKGNMEAYLNIVTHELEAELQNFNCYGEPKWILWKRYLQDALDVLMLWEQAVSNQRLPIILKSF